VVSWMLVGLSVICINNLCYTGWSGLWWRDLIAVLGPIGSGPTALFALSPDYSPTRRFSLHRKPVPLRK